MTFKRTVIRLSWVVCAGAGGSGWNALKRLAAGFLLEGTARVKEFLVAGGGLEPPT